MSNIFQDRLDEISKKTLVSYANKAADDATTLARKTVVGGTPEERAAQYDKIDAKIDKRLAGASKAVAKAAAKNESEEMTEAEEQANFSRAMDRIHPTKRDAARKMYISARKKGLTHSAALTTMHNMYSEAVELDEATILSGRPTTHAEHEYSTSAGTHSTSHVEKTLGLKTGSISKDKKTYIKHGDVHLKTEPVGKKVMVRMVRKIGKFGQDTSKHDAQRASIHSSLNEEVELDEAYHVLKRAKELSGSEHESVELDEKTLTPAEMKKREEVAKALERKTPGMDMSKKMAIATAVAKKVAESEQLDELSKATLMAADEKYRKITNDKSSSIDDVRKASKRSYHITKKLTYGNYTKTDAEKNQDGLMKNVHKEYGKGRYMGD